MCHKCGCDNVRLEFTVLYCNVSFVYTAIFSVCMYVTGDLPEIILIIYFHTSHVCIHTNIAYSNAVHEYAHKYEQK